ncbi:MAG TPA: Gldg family protein [Vicinamibacterales bacterium]|nr:Gldg family protein [Vicinamibacterales bacterium]
MKRLIGLIGWLAVLLIVAAVFLRFARPDLQPWSQRLAIGGLIVMALYAASQWRDILRAFQGRNVKYGSMAVSSVVLVLAILVAINWISSRENKRWDVTAAGQFSLSDQTKKILSGLKQPLAIHVFYQGSPQDYRDRLAEYSYQSKEVTANYVDVDRNPVEAQKYGITTVPSFVLEYAGRTEKANAPDEQTITNALKKVVEGQAKKVYFTQGHGERDLTASTPQGFSGIADALKTDNFETAPLQLVQAGKVPDDATVVVIAGPKTDLLQPEVDALKAYLARGGKLAILLDPPDKATDPEPTNLIALAHDWGFDIGRNIVIDASGLGQLLGTDASVPVAMPVQHPITDNFRVMTAFPLARSVTPIDGGTNGHVAEKVLQTRPESWAEADIKDLYATGRPERNLDKGDKAGPITIAAAVTAPATVTPPAPKAADGSTPAPAADAPKPETRVVVVGDSDFASNSALGIQGNREIFLNMANWLAQQEDLIAIRPKDPQSRPLTMTDDQGRMIFWLTMVIIPAFLFGAGVRMWWKGR